MLRIEFTSQFKKDYKLAMKRGLPKNELEKVISLLSAEKKLPEKYMDHELISSKNYKNVRECHIKPDWLLIYRVERENLILKLLRTGSHSDLF